MIECWDGVFRSQLPRSTRNLLFTLRDKRNEWAHNRAIQPHDAQFTLSGILTMLEAIDARESDRVQISLDELNRSLFAREKEKVEAEGAASNVLEAPKAGLKPWRDVIRPHDDVSTGTFNVAEFAADLELVRQGEGSAEYVDPVLFFERTYLTVGLAELLSLGVKRVSGQGGQPVINCQTNFGGGKTHSLIALYHLFSGRCAGVPTRRGPPDRLGRWCGRAPRREPCGSGREPIRSWRDPREAGRHCRPDHLG